MKTCTPTKIAKPVRYIIKRCKGNRVAIANACFAERVPGVESGMSLNRISEHLGALPGPVIQRIAARF